MKKPYTEIQNALKNVGTATKDVTQEALSSKLAEETLRIMKSSAEAESIGDALETALKALLKK